MPPTPQRQEELATMAKALGYGMDVVNMRGYEVCDAVTTVCRDALSINPEIDTYDLASKEREELSVLLVGVRDVVCYRRAELQSFVARALAVADAINAAGRSSGTIGFSAGREINH